MNRHHTKAARRRSFRKYMEREEWPLEMVLMVQVAERLRAILSRARRDGVL